MEPLDAETPAAPEQPKKPRKINRYWAALFIALGVGLLVRYGAEHRSRSVDKGDEIVSKVVGLTEQAQRAHQGKDLDAARRNMAQAINILREADEFKSHPVYVSTLIDMGALLLGAQTPGDSEIVEGRTLLTEAWEVAKGLDVRTRWRIARDLGLAAVLAGDMGEAEKWYSTATELVPEDKVSKDRLTTLRSVQKWK